MTIEATVLAFANRQGSGNLLCNSTIVDGRKIPSTPTNWYGGFRRKAAHDVVADTDGGTVVLTKWNVTSRLAQFDRHFAPAYRNVLQDPAWLAFYHASPHPVPWQCYAQDGQRAPDIFQTGIPCTRCGLFLPLQAIQIDHSRPQQGEIMEAIAKFFRHMNLTVGGAKGAKGRSVAAMKPVGTLQERYTLDPLGRMLFQLIVSAGAQGDLERAALHSYANLRPMCAQCNTARNALPANKF